MAVVSVLYCAFLLCSIVILFTVNCNCFIEEIDDDDDDDDDDDEFVAHKLNVFYSEELYRQSNAIL